MAKAGRGPPKPPPLSRLFAAEVGGGGVGRGAGAWPGGPPRPAAKAGGGVRDGMAATEVAHMAALGPVFLGVWRGFSKCFSQKTRFISASIAQRRSEELWTKANSLNPR